MPTSRLVVGGQGPIIGFTGAVLKVGGADVTGHLHGKTVSEIVRGRLSAHGMPMQLEAPVPVRSVNFGIAGGSKSRLFRGPPENSYPTKNP